LPAFPLQEFVRGAGAWMHIDTGAWTQGAYACAGRPEGGEALGLRALLAFISERYGGTGAQE
jgi:leucyl aminopeptidase